MKIIIFHEMLFIFILIIVTDSHAWFFKTKNNKGIVKSNTKWYDTICWVTNCEKTVQESEENSKYSLDPRCWFTNCNTNANRRDKETENLWLTDEQIINWGKEKLYNLKCLFKECPPEKKKEEKKEDLTVYGKVKNFLNSVKPEEPIIETFFKSEWSPYCWHSECCNNESIPSNTKSKNYFFISLKCKITKLLNLILRY